MSAARLVRSFAARVAAHALDEAVGGRVDVQEAGAAGAGVAEAVPHAGGSGDERARADADGLVADRELELALEDVEGIELVGMDVRVDRPELWVARELDHLELVALGLDDEVAVLTRDGFTLAGA